MADSLRIGLLQMRSGIAPQANRAAASDMLRQAAAQGARLVASPEMTPRLDRDRKRMLARVEHEDLAAEIKAWGRLAREHGLWLLLGSMAVWAGAGRIHNRSLLFSPDGDVCAQYDKINLFDVELGGGETYRESEAVLAGNALVTHQIAGQAVLGLTICYDLRFPELFGALARAGAQIIAVPSAFTRLTGAAHWEVLLRARAIETGAFVIAPAQGGSHEDGRATWGHSMVIGPWGDVLARFDHDEPGLLLADLDLAQCAAARARIPAWRGGGQFGSVL
jgi:deaminated glutathione amidase